MNLLPSRETQPSVQLNVSLTEVQTQQFVFTLPMKIQIFWILDWNLSSISVVWCSFCVFLRLVSLISVGILRWSVHSQSGKGTRARTSASQRILNKRSSPMLPTSPGCSGHSCWGEDSLIPPSHVRRISRLVSIVNPKEPGGVLKNKTTEDSKR